MKTYIEWKIVYLIILINIENNNQIFNIET